jgi:hypothetical protein
MTESALCMCCKCSTSAGHLRIQDIPHNEKPSNKYKWFTRSSKMEPGTPDFNASNAC